MADPSIYEIMQALAGQIQDNLASGTATPVIDGLQVEPLLVINPTPPQIDIYPADPFQEPQAFGKGNNNMRFTVRVRVTTSDEEGGQKLLLSMMDPRSNESVALAILDDRTLGGTVSYLNVEGPSDFGAFPSPDPQAGGAYLGCTWTALVTP